MVKCLHVIGQKRPLLETQCTCTTTQSNFQSFKAKICSVKISAARFLQICHLHQIYDSPFPEFAIDSFHQITKSSHLWYTCTRENRYVQLFLQKTTMNYYYPVCSRTVKHILDTAVYLYFYREQYKSASLTLCDLALIF